VRDDGAPSPRHRRPYLEVSRAEPKDTRPSLTGNGGRATGALEEGTQPGVTAVSGKKGGPPSSKNPPS